MHWSGGERFEKEQLTQPGRTERRVGSWDLTEKRLFMGKQGMTRGKEERGMIAIVMGMLLNSFRTRSGSTVASKRHCSRSNILCQQDFRWVAYARAMPMCPISSLPCPIAQRAEG